MIILLYLLFFISFFCVYAKEKGLHDSDNNDIANVEDILRELNAERAKNRDLNQTISDILDRILIMEDDIVTNRARITENRSFMMLLSDDVTVLTDEVAAVEEDVVNVSSTLSSLTEDVGSLTLSDQQQETQIGENIQRLEALSSRGR